MAHVMFTSTEEGSHEQIANREHADGVFQRKRSGSQIVCATTVNRFNCRFCKEVLKRFQKSVKRVQPEKSVVIAMQTVIRCWQYW